MTQRSFDIASHSSHNDTDSKDKNIDVETRVYSDAQVVETCHRFLDDHRLLVEPACGAALNVVYNDGAGLDFGGRPIAVVVCGGSGISLDILSQWRTQFGV